MLYLAAIIGVLLFNYALTELSKRSEYFCV